LREMLNRYGRLVVAALIAVVACALLQSVGLPSTSPDVYACGAPLSRATDWCVLGKPPPGLPG
jgi:hypothetical protein